MANKKITELTALTEAEESDLLVIVDDPSGSPMTKKITVNNLLAEVTSHIGSSNFAGPGGVTITHNLNLANYIPDVMPSADSGAVGAIWITDVAVNTFVVRNSGSGVTAFTWSIHY